MAQRDAAAAADSRSARAVRAAVRHGRGPEPEETDRQARYRRSILDFVTDDTKKLQTSLGPTDKRKLDEYLSSIREVERQLEKAEKESVADRTRGMDKPYGVPPDFAEHFKLMTDMMTIAFQADLTRVRHVPDDARGHQPRRTARSASPTATIRCTHHQGKPELMEKVTQINEYHTKQLAGWLGKLKSIKEGDSNLLDNSMIVYGAGLSDGNRHLHDDLPTLLIGRGGELLQAGPPRHLPQGNADVEFPSDADGSHGRADGELRRRVGPARSGEPDVARRRAV